MFAEEQEPAPSSGAALIDPLSELPGLLRDLILSAERSLRAFRLTGSGPTPPYVQEEFRRILDRRLMEGSITLERVELFTNLKRFGEVLANLQRYRGKPYFVRALTAANNVAVPAMGGYLFDEEEFLLGTYWPDRPGGGAQDLRLSGEPFRRYFQGYWQTIWHTGIPLNPDGALDPEACRMVARQLGLAETAWPEYLARHETMTLEDDLPPTA